MMEPYQEANRAKIMEYSKARFEANKEEIKKRSKVIWPKLSKQNIFLKKGGPNYGHRIV